MRILDVSKADFAQVYSKLLARRNELISELAPSVDAQIEIFRKEREQALINWSDQFDGVQLQENELWIEEDLIRKSHKLVSADIRKAIDHAVSRIERFQSELRLPSFQMTDEAGVSWGTEVRPLDRVGVYVPGGRANYFMTLLVCAVPAKIAGVKEIVVATPPKKNLKKPFVDPTILYLAKLFDISNILISGGVGALAAMALGTKRVGPVQKIFGTGSRRTAVAKTRLAGFVGVEGFSGPSETAFICDKSTSNKTLAADIIGRADHDPEAEIFVFHTEQRMMEELVVNLATELEAIREQGNRKLVQSCLEFHTNFFVVKNLKDAVEKVNSLSPGIVCLPVDGAADLVGQLGSCGHALLGHYTPPVGLDLVGGPSGLVSTMGAAVYSTSMSPASFCRRFTAMEFDRSALDRFQQESMRLAQQEGFTTHDASFRSRLSPDEDAKEPRRR